MYITFAQYEKWVDTTKETQTRMDAMNVRCVCCVCVRACI